MTSKLMPNGTIGYEVANDVATIRLNRPESYNAFVDEMHDDIRVAMKKVKQNSDLRALVLTGNGKAFCTGQDLKNRYELIQKGKPDLGKSLSATYNQLIDGITNLNIPTICIVNGVAAGAGVSIALACDFVIASETAKFIFAFGKVGLVPDSGGTWSLIQALGLPRARALCLLGDTLEATSAAQQGLIWKAVPPSQMESEQQKLIERLKANPAQGLALTKRALLKATNSSLNEQLANEASFQTIAGRTDDYAEAINAFVEKRTPQFNGQ